MKPSGVFLFSILALLQVFVRTQVGTQRPPYVYSRRVPQQKILMPELISKDVRAAEEALKRLSPDLRIVKKAIRSSLYAPGQVVQQEPTANTELAPTTTIVLYYRASPFLDLPGRDIIELIQNRPKSTPTPTPVPTPSLQTIPDVVGMPIKTAMRKVAAAGFDVNALDKVETAGPSGVVLQQFPPAGETAKPNSTIRLVMSVPLRQFPTPNLRGYTLEEATQILTKSGLIAGSIMGDQKNPRTAIVERQFPLPDTPISRGAAVQLELVRPPQPTPTSTTTPKPTPSSTATALPTGTPSRTPVPTASPRTVPDVQGKNLAEAIALLHAATLEIGTVRDEVSDSTAATIVKQQPIPGSLLAAGGRVHVWIAKPQEAAGFPVHLIKIIGVFMTGFLVLAAAKLWSRKQNGRKSNSQASAPQLQTRTAINPGRQRITATASPAVPFRLRFRPNVNTGRQRIAKINGLIASESEEV